MFVAKENSSLGPGSALGKKEKKFDGDEKKNSASEASREVV